MADTPLSPAQLVPVGADTKKTLIDRLKAGIVANAGTVLGALVVLTVMVIGMYVYYHGFLFLGPYAAAAAGGAKEGFRGGDAETERLIDSINSQ